MTKKCEHGDEYRNSTWNYDIDDYECIACIKQNERTQAFQEVLKIIYQTRYYHLNRGDLTSELEQSLEKIKNKIKEKMKL